MGSSEQLDIGHSWSRRDNYVGERAAEKKDFVNHQSSCLRLCGSLYLGYRGFNNLLGEIEESLRHQ